MKETNKRIMSLLLSGALVSSVATTTASALEVNGTENKTYSLSEEYSQEKMYSMDGIFTVLVNNVPVYVYLGNEYRNEYLTKMDALFVGELNYEKVYVFSKTVNNPNYIQGVSPYNERTITIYALSGKTYANGWTRIDKKNLGTEDMIATSIELGEFLLKGVDLSVYKSNMIGFANVDINKDGKNEIMYIGNNVENALMTKEEAIRFAISNYDNYYIQSKTIKGTNNKQIKIYAISDKSYVSGWTRINKSQLPSDAKIGTNTEFMLALAHVDAHSVTETVTVEVPNEEIKEPGYVSNCLKKNDALTYGYNNYPMFCVMTRTIVDPKTKENITMYAFSVSLEVEGWTIIGNDSIPDDAYIFLTMNDANNYEYYIKNNVTKTLS